MSGLTPRGTCRLSASRLAESKGFRVRMAAKRVSIDMG
jgi:hypothetical protein